MSTKLSPTDEEFYRRVDEVLHYIWDPIGISGIPMARDEYHSYLPQVFNLLKANVKPEPIAKYLAEISTERMGLQENREKDFEIAEILLDWKETIYEKHS